MKQILLDTSFILTAVRNKIDFFEQLEHQGFQILIPEQVIRELTALKGKLALKLLEKNKFKKIDLKTKNTDNGIVKYSKEHDIATATLDRELKKRVRGQRMVIRGKKKLEVL